MASESNIRSNAFSDTPCNTLDTKIMSSTTLDAESGAVVNVNRMSGMQNTFLRWRSLLREPAAEFLGTMVLVIFGVGVSCQATLSSSVDVSSSPKGSFETGIIGWAAGAALGVWLSIDISGGHINPVVTLVLALLGRFPWKKFPIYFLAQTLGAFFGSLLIYANYYSAIDIFEKGARTVPGTASLFATYPAHYISNGSAFFSEFLTTAVFMIGVLAITHKRKDPHPRGLVAFGIFILLLGENACLGMQTSYAINPARDLGPRLMTWIFYGNNVWNFRTQYWLWTPILGPFCGGIAGALVYTLFVHYEDEHTESLPVIMPHKA